MFIIEPLRSEAAKIFEGMDQKTACPKPLVAAFAV
jgi:hypothetical protein